MRNVVPVRPFNNPLTVERSVLSRLSTEHGFEHDSLRVRVFGQKLLLDGFVSDLDSKAKIAQACKQIVPGMQIVNRLRVGRSRDSVLS